MSIRIGFVVGMLAATVSYGGTDKLLITELYRFRLADTTVGQAQALETATDANAAEQIRTAAAAWKAGQMATVRANLEEHFGDRARDVFQKFVEEYTRAENQADMAYLGALAATAGLTPPPSHYDELAQWVLQQFLSREMEEAANFLSEIETWLSVRAKNETAPPLDTWLHRHELAQASAATAPAPSPPPRPRNPLRDAEAPPPEFVPPDEADESGFAVFTAARSDRREKALQEAQAGMQQVAAERDAAEKEYAAAKMAAAQAEAEAMRKHAEKLAAVEQEALEQRKNSWSGRLKQVVSATIGAAGGAFFGGIGSRAGEAAANAVFKE